MRWRPATLQPTDWAIPRISLIVPESSLARDQCHICWAMNVDDLIKSDVSTVLNAILLLSVSWWFEGFDDQGRNRRYCLSLGLSVLNGQFHCNPQTLPITSCLGDVITDLFWRQTQGTNLGGQGRRDTDFPPVHLRYKALISLRLNLNSMVEVARVG